MVLPSLATVVSIIVVYGVLFAMLRRPWTTTGLTLYLLCFVLLSSIVKQAYLGMAVTMADMHFFLLRPLENFRLFVNYPLLGLTSLMVIAGVVVCCVVGLRFEQPVRLFDRPQTGGWIRIATASAAVLIAVIGSLLASRHSDARANNGDSYSAFLTMYEQEHPRGWMGRLNLFFNNRSFAAELPPEHPQSRFTTPTPNVLSMKSEVKSEIKPDVLLILEESIFDPRLIRDCPTALCDNSMFHPAASSIRTQQGPLLVHTSGGGTWLSEFAVMSGFDWRVFGRGGGYAPVSLAPRLRHSLPMRLRELGYRTVAIYPTEGNFLSATTAYQQYGFDEFYDAQDLDMPNEWGDVHDGLIFDKLLATLAQKHDERPVFVFVLTIRNHGPHGTDIKAIPEPFRALEATLTAPIADYLARARDSSNAFNKLSTQWLRTGHPRVIGWFGDHQPEAAWDYTENPKSIDTQWLATNLVGEQLKNVTYYQFSANFGDPKIESAKTALDISYLGMHLLEFSNLPLDAGQQAAQTVATLCNGQMLDCADSHLIDDYLSYRIHQLHDVQ
jgi:Sulfatase